MSEGEAVPSIPSLENFREARRQAALARLKAAGGAPALAAEAQTSLASAFALSDVLRRIG